MKRSLLSPCREWAEKLAIAHTADLSFADRQALEEHIVSCLACNAVLREYRALDERLHLVLHFQPSLPVSSELLYLEEENTREETSETSKEHRKREVIRWRRDGLSSHSGSSSHSAVGKTFRTLVAILVLSILVSGFYVLSPARHFSTTIGAIPTDPTCVNAVSTIPQVHSTASAGKPAFIRLIDASSFVGTFDVFVGGQALLTSFEFGAVTDYVPVPSGSHKVQISLVGKGINGAVVTKTLPVQAGKMYTIAALGTSATNITASVFSDDKPSASGKASVTFYNFSPDGSPVEVSTSGGTAFQCLFYASTSSVSTGFSVALLPGQYSFQFTPTHAKPIHMAPLVIEADVVTSIFLVGSLDGTPSINPVWIRVASLPGLCNC